MRIWLLSIVLMISMAACGGTEADLPDEELGETTSEATAACWTSGSYTYSGSSCFTYDQMRHRAYNFCRDLYGACAQGSVWGISSCGNGTYWKWGYSCVRCSSCPY